MTDVQVDTINGLIQRIEATPPESRFAEIPKLRRAIALREATGEMPPSGARQMLRTLEEEAVESLFDNMPV